jgi:hypothetical protein
MQLRLGGRESLRAGGIPATASAIVASSLTMTRPFSPAVKSTRTPPRLPGSSLTISPLFASPVGEQRWSDQLCHHGIELGGLVDKRLPLGSQAFS